jgi:threonyl-tRNA synthetase
MGILVEHTAGAFPLWLAPVQAVVLPITDRAHEYARTVAEEARAIGLRVELDLRNEKINAKIRDHQLMKVPYMLVIGDREAAAGQVAVRHRHAGDQGAKPVGEVLTALQDEAASRRR